jgi:glycerate dehydrogenase
MHSESVKSGQWSASSDFCYWIWPLIELKGKTLGIVGLGKIGREVAKISQAFDMKVIAHDRFVLVDKEIPLVEFDELLKESDFISLHCPLTAETNKFINHERISQMKSSAFIINTSRGALIDEHALADALNQGRIAGAGLDVLSKEPPIPENPLLSAKNCFITPHIAWATLEARERLLNLAVSNIVAFLDGTPVNTVG